MSWDREQTVTSYNKLLHVNQKHGASKREQDVAMAYESFYWKTVMARELKYIERKMLLTHRDIEGDLDAEFSKMEIKIMTLAYVVRKLSDSGKLPDDTLSKRIKVTRYPRTTHPAIIFTDFEREYDLTQPASMYLDTRRICNQIIHSYVLELIGNSRRVFRYLLFVSDQDKKKGLYELSMRDFVNMIEHVRTATVASIDARYDVVSDKWIYHRS